AKLVDWHDVGMIECRSGIRLTPEPRQERLPRLLVHRRAALQHLDGDLAAWTQLLSEIDRSHPTSAQRTLQHALAELQSNQLVRLPVLTKYHRSPSPNAPCGAYLPLHADCRYLPA